MTRSIFDPTGGQTEHSGNRNMGPQADNISHMPPDVVDGEVSDEEVAEQEAMRAKEEKANPDAASGVRPIPGSESEQSKMPRE
ncbi:MAG TPA: hypothetical protein VFE47_22265 [Tepidisphaeraceae bacterium]|jgi:hypothetical protein|nr:hypothetical protein [Tepidisphaeraceae bacterium]